MDPRESSRASRSNSWCPLAATLSAPQRAAVLAVLNQFDQMDRFGQELNIRPVNDARAALFHSRVSVVASGTATVEAAPDRQSRLS